MKQLVLTLCLLTFLTSCGEVDTNKTTPENGKTEKVETEKNETEKIEVQQEKTTKNNSSFESHTSYDAGKYEGQESLDVMDNPDVKKARKSANKNFSKNWDSAAQYYFPDNGKEGESVYLKTPGDNFKVRKNISKTVEKYIVEENEKDIYESNETFMLTSDAFKNFIVDKNNWYLLYDENTPEIENKKSESNTKLIHNGEEVKNFQTFSLVSIQGKIFYFFKENETSKVNYYLDGKIYTTNFDEIIHNKCCMISVFNLEVSNDGKVKFWGVKDGKLSFNEVILLGFSKSSKI